MTAEQVAKKADDYFDRQGKPIEKNAAPINHISTTANPSSTASANASSAATPFTAAYSDEEDTDVNFVRKGGQRGQGQGQGQGRNGSRFQRSRSRPGFNRNPTTSSTGNPSSSSSSASSSSSSFAPGTCRWHRRFGDKSLKCVTDCPLFKDHVAKQKQGNGQGGRRM